MSDKQQRDAMRAWPTHEVHGEPGFVTCRRSILEALLDELESAEQDRDAAVKQGHGSALRVLELEGKLADLERDRDVKAAALRHLAGVFDTLSPQEVINVCADALGWERWNYSGQVDPDLSLVQLTSRLRGTG